MIVSDITDQAEAIYNDTDNDRVSVATWITFLNDATKQLILVRPDSNTLTAAVKLTSGTKQALPSAALRLIDITRNMGVSGISPGSPIMPVEKEALKWAVSSFHTDTPENEVENYYYDTKNPKVFYCYPPNTGAGYIELVYSIVHATLTAVTDSLTFDEIFINPLLSWCMYRAFLIDTDSSVNWNRANHFHSDFYSSLGIDMRVQDAVAPQPKETING